MPKNNDNEVIRILGKEKWLDPLPEDAKGMSSLDFAVDRDRSQFR
jgi:hypothetical protein